ncbi:MAG: ABC transporter substrate-binding protein [Alphaproteobacteria bacterium]|nr:ABC transporter substrate-binding protein [Alphaproteobacteria bacterium]
MLHRLALALLAALLFSLPAQAQKDSVAIGMTLEPPHLDPTGGSPAQAIREVTYLNIYEGLVRLDRDGKIQPLLATSWTTSPDGLTYYFRLRDGVTFHDGAAFDASAAKFTLERAMAADSTNSQKWIFAPIAGIEAPDVSTLVVKLKEPTANFLYGLAWGDAVMFHANSVANNKTNPVGTGPYKFERWNRGDRVELVRNETYWRSGAATLRRASFRFIADAQAQVNALRAGDIDALPNMAGPEAVEPLKTDRRFTVAIGATEGETIVGLNNQKAPFNDVRVRRALSHAIDRRQVIAGAMSGAGTPIGAHFSPLHPAYVDLTGQYPYDPAKARALLAEAGHPNGFAATLRLPPPPYARRSGEVVAALLAQVGVRVTIEPMEFAQWLDQVFRNKNFDMTIISHTEPLDIGIYARDDYYFGYRDAEFKALIERIGRTLDEAERNRLYGEAQRKLAADAVNVFLFQLPKIGVWSANLQGMWENWPLPANPLAELRWR